MRSVKQVLDAKGRALWSIAPDESVLEAIRLMADKGIGALLVVQDGGLKGIVTERDYARKVILAGHSSADTRVEAIMTRRVLCTRPGDTVEECMALMTERRVRHLPVLDGDCLVGLVSIGDLVKAVIADQKFMIAELERYISG